MTNGAFSCFFRRFGSSLFPFYELFLLETGSKCSWKAKKFFLSFVDLSPQYTLIIIVARHLWYQHIFLLLNIINFKTENKQNMKRKWKDNFAK